MVLKRIQNVCSRTEYAHAPQIISYYAFWSRKCKRTSNFLSLPKEPHHHDVTLNCSNLSRAELLSNLSHAELLSNLRHFEQFKLKSRRTSLKLKLRQTSLKLKSRRTSPKLKSRRMTSL